jgi:hypothetical protein
MNLCGACGQDFASLEAFDRHRSGLHGFTFAERLAMTPPRYDGRRCLDPAELEAMGWQRNQRGRWFDPSRASRAARMRRPSADMASAVVSS